VCKVDNYIQLVFDTKKMYIVYIISTMSNTIKVDWLNQLVPAFELDLQLELVQKNHSFDCHSLAQLWLEPIAAMACSWLLARAVATLVLCASLGLFTVSLVPHNGTPLLYTKKYEKTIRVEYSKIQR